MGFDGDYNALWQEVLRDLAGQMTAGTFGTWLQGTSACGEGERIVVYLASQYGQEWVEKKLRGMVERTVQRVAGQALTVEFVVREREEQRGRGQGTVEPQVAQFVVPVYDVHEAGWFPISEYECRFWAPLLGRVAWRVWEIVRREDRRKEKSEWTPAQRWTAPGLARLVPCGVQAVVGVERSCAPTEPGAYQVEGGWRQRQPGAFDRLREEKVATIERKGSKPHVTYWVAVRVKLGLLSPAQVARLAAELQVQHDRWLEEHGFDPREWD